MNRMMCRGKVENFSSNYLPVTLSTRGFLLFTVSVDSFCLTIRHVI
jgi:hypothetical protein